MPGRRHSQMAATVTPAPDDKVVSYLRRPYARIIVPEADGTYRGEILEFPGCIALGDTAAEALDNLEEVAAQWLEIALEHEQPIPEPIESGSEFSGRLILRMPKSLHKKAAYLAERDGVSLNQFIVTGLAEHVGGRSQFHSQVTTFNFAFSNAATFVRNITVTNSANTVLKPDNNFVTIDMSTSSREPLSSGLGQHSGYTYQLEAHLRNLIPILPSR
jgi:antitoxin HicB